MIEIPRFEDEIDQMKNYNKKPIDLYLDHCQKYSKANLMQKTIEIKDYSVQFRDVENQIFVGSTNQPDITNFGNLYESLDVKVFKDIVFVNNKQQILVKTWEKMKDIAT